MPNPLSRVANLLGRAGRAAWRELRAAAIDLRYGRYLGGRHPTRFGADGATDVQSTPYTWLDAAFEHVQIRPDDILVDVGCGQGRVINWWLSRGLKNRLIGVELDPDVAASARARLQRWSNVSIVTGSILERLPPDGTLFYMFNPFGRDVRAALAGQLASRGGSATVLYVNAKHPGVFEADPRWQVEHFTLGEWPAIVARLQLPAGSG